MSYELKESDKPVTYYVKAIRDKYRPRKRASKNRP